MYDPLVCGAYSGQCTYGVLWQFSERRNGAYMLIYLVIMACTQDGMLVSQHANDLAEP
jgi:hypothetical protein